MRLHVFAALALALILPCSALAQPRDPKEAEALFNRAREQMSRKEYQTACPLLVKSQELDPAAVTLLNLADCEEHVGDLAGAWTHWHDGIAGLPASHAYVAEAKQRLEALDVRVPKLIVRLAPGVPPGARVLRDGAELAPSSLGVPFVVNTGAHEIVVQAAGRSDRQETVTLVEGERKERVVEPGVETAVAPPMPVAPVPSAPPIAAPAPEQSTAAPSKWSKHRGSILTLAGGGVLAGIGLGLAVKTLPDHVAFTQTCGMKVCTDADVAGLRREAVAANVLLGLGAAAGITAGILFFAVERPKKASVAVNPTGAGASIVVRY